MIGWHFVRVKTCLRITGMGGESKLCNGQTKASKEAISGRKRNAVRQTTRRYENENECRQWEQERTPRHVHTPFKVNVG